MMETKIFEQLKQALKGGEKTKVSVLRMLISEMKNKKIADKTKELTDESVIAIIKKTVRRHNESIEKFIEGKRIDLAEKEKAEKAILEVYLPEEMTSEALESVIFEVIKETGASSMKDMGAVMKAVAIRTKGAADGKTVSEIVRRELTKEN
ncbi:MAG: GatB/YqeY domain-containing protein [Candidatus Omnitrophica bacterium]|nr:GatB/YqeY domain-containing protein [Candidatus Omnitrophota bacterium]